MTTDDIHIYNTISILEHENIPIYIEYIPSHVDIAGNDIADKLAKDALLLPAILLPVNLSKTEVYSIINNSIKNKWENYWKNLDQNNHLRSITEIPNNNPINYGKNKTEDSYYQIKARNHKIKRGNT